MVSGRNWLKAEPLSETLKRLAQKGSKINFQTFQGLNDKNTPASFVQKFEAWNSKRAVDQKHSLSFNVRYYEADHKLYLTALNDMVMILLAYISE